MNFDTSDPLQGWGVVTRKSLQCNYLYGDVFVQPLVADQYFGGSRPIIWSMPQLLPASAGFCGRSRRHAPDGRAASRVALRGQTPDQAYFNRLPQIAAA